MTLTNILWASGWAIWAPVCSGKCDYSGASIGRSLHSQHPQATACPNHISSTRAIHQTNRGPGTGPGPPASSWALPSGVIWLLLSQSQDQGCSYGNDPPALPVLLQASATPLHPQSCLVGAGKELLASHGRTKSGWGERPGF